MPGLETRALHSRPYGLAILAALLLPALPQPAAYHDFADRRAMLGIANFADVASNLAFLLAGIAGRAIVFSRRTRFELPAARYNKQCIPT